jgi:hypothetical protein
MTYHRAENRPGQLAADWEGDLAASVTTRTPDRTRWVEIKVYHLEDGSWLAHRAGVSTIYHRAATGCRRKNLRKPGMVATVRDLPDDAEPCSQCNPPYPEDLDDDEQIRFEFPQHTIDRGTPAEIVAALTTSRKPDSGARVVKISGPVRDLLEELMGSYPEFSGLSMPTEGVYGPLDQGEDHGDEDRDDLPDTQPARRGPDDQAPAVRGAG